ncbi:MAG: cytochrome-c peroxidase [Dehalococcoidia bacterium]
MKSLSVRRACAVVVVLSTATGAWAKEGDSNHSSNDDLIEAIREYLEEREDARWGSWRRNLPPPTSDDDFADSDPAKEQLGKFLFHDKILSGNQNISCSSCHHVFAGTSDGLSLPIGEGARGVSVTRSTGELTDAVHERVPRNAPALFNLGALEFSVMFHDGRVAADRSQPSGFASPAGNDLPSGLDSALAAQAMFPVTSATEMAGQPGENSIADAAGIGNLAGAGGVWDQLAQRLRANAEYVELFKDAFDDVNSAADITYVHAANAIAAFEGAEWRADDSPFDRFLRTRRRTEMSAGAFRGMKLFYGSAGCISCHSGVFQTDHAFHTIGVPQVGPGKGHNAPGQTDGHDDLGREAVTGSADDRFRFRTPSLRNVALTGPFGHGGAYDDLETIVRHHLDAEHSLWTYDPDQLVLPSRSDLDAQDLIVMSDPARVAFLAGYIEIPRNDLRDRQVADLITFLREGLTDSRSIDLLSGQPLRVPSGLPVFD